MRKESRDRPSTARRRVGRMSGGSRWNPFAALSRSWGHFVRRPRRTQLRTIVLIGAVVAGVAVWLATSPSSTSSGSAATASPTTTHAAGGPTPVERGEHLDQGDPRKLDQRGVPGRLAQLARWPGRVCRRPRVRRADQGDPVLRQADQRQRRDQRASHQSDHHQLRPDQRIGDPRPLQDLDRRIAGGLRGARRDRRLDGRQPALHHPGRPDALHRWVEHRDQLDQPGLALPLVDRTRPRGDPPGGGGLGAQRAPARRLPGGRGDRRRPCLGPTGPERLPPAGPAPSRRHPSGRDHRVGPDRVGDDQLGGSLGDPAASQRRGWTRSSR